MTQIERLNSIREEIKDEWVSDCCEKEIINVVVNVKNHNVVARCSGCKDIIRWHGLI